MYDETYTEEIEQELIEAEKRLTDADFYQASYDWLTEAVYEQTLLKLSFENGKYSFEKAQELALNEVKKADSLSINLVDGFYKGFPIHEKARKAVIADIRAGKVKISSYFDGW